MLRSSCFGKRPRPLKRSPRPSRRAPSMRSPCCYPTNYHRFGDSPTDSLKHGIRPREKKRQRVAYGRYAQRLNPRWPQRVVRRRAKWRCSRRCSMRTTRWKSLPLHCGCTKGRVVTQSRCALKLRTRRPYDRHRRHAVGCPWLVVATRAALQARQASNAFSSLLESATTYELVTWLVRSRTKWEFLVSASARSNSSNRTRSWSSARTMRRRPLKCSRISHCVDVD